MRILAAVLFMLVVSVGYSQQLKLTAKTGDADMDIQLKDINTKALADPEQFKIDASATFSIGKPKIDIMLTTMAPGDVYMALQLANSTGKPVDDVVSSFKKNKDKGWGVIAKEMGIKPGSPEFHAMKKALKENKNKGKGKDKGDKNKGKPEESKGKGKKK
jgi:hypothetical protein